MSSLYLTNQLKFFWNTLAPNLTSSKIAFSLDFVVTVSYPQDDNFTANVSWQKVQIRCPCRRTWLQFVDSLYLTVVLDPAQLPLFEIAKFICFSSFLIRCLCLVYCKYSNKKPPYGGLVDTLHTGTRILYTYRVRANVYNWSAIYAG